MTSNLNPYIPVTCIAVAAIGYSASRWSTPNVPGKALRQGVLSACVSSAVVLGLRHFFHETDAEAHALLVFWVATALSTATGGELGGAVRRRHEKATAAGGPTQGSTTPEQP